MTVPTIADVIAQIVSVVKAVDGIRNAPAYPPDQLASWPAVIVYPSTGDFVTGAFGLDAGYHNIAVEVRVPDKDSARAIASLVPFVDSIPVALTNDPWMNQLSEPFTKISYSLFYGLYDTTQTVGYRFIITGLKMFSTGKQ